HRHGGPIFRTPSGSALTVGNLSGTHRRLRDAAGLPKDLVPYLARHRFGTEALRAGVPLKDVADLMGHASVTTTEIYLHRDVTELAGSQDRVPDLGPTYEPRDLAGGFVVIATSECNSVEAPARFGLSCCWRRSPRAVDVT